MEEETEVKNLDFFTRQDKHGMLESELFRTLFAATASCTLKKDNAANKQRGTGTAGSRSHTPLLVRTICNGDKGSRAK